MSSRGGGAARLATRLREQTASAGAAGAEPTTGTPQRNRPCQCHRPSRGKASILPSKCALFPPGPPLAIVPGSLPVPPVLPDGAAAGIVYPAAPEGFGGSPRRSDPPTPHRAPRGADGVGELGETPPSCGKEQPGAERRNSPRAGHLPLAHPTAGWWGCSARERASRFPKPSGCPSRGTLFCPIADLPDSLQPMSERSGLLAAGAQLPRFRNATSKSS